MAFGEARYTAENDQPLDTEVDGEIRKFVQREVVTTPGRQPDTESDLVANNLNSLLQRATGTSVQEIDRMITELQMLRDRLPSETARVQSEIVEYATLTQAALHSTKIIGESLTQLKKARRGRPTESLRPLTIEPNSVSVLASESTNSWRPPRSPTALRSAATTASGCGLRLRSTAVIGKPCASWPLPAASPARTCAT